MVVEDWLSAMSPQAKEAVEDVAAKVVVVREPAVV